ncbi:MAG: Helix-turn-helix type 11 domain protein [Neobacillus sp.]|jgi:predicted DNA-binding transcriptional regulator YafY|nr:Helix-turn-helix type 11 domain protein [Neobacillus sp.]
MKIITLIQSKPGIMTKELAEVCETTERTIYRDLELLSAANIPITSEGYGKGNKFIGNFALYPLDWTEKEAVAFSMLPGLLDQVNRFIPSEFYSAFEKVVAAHQKEQKNQLDFLQEMVTIIQLGTPASQKQHKTFLLEVVQAILNSQTIEVNYHTQSRNVVTSRTLDPYYLIPRENRYYLIAFCHEKAEFRTFRMSRFLDVKQTKKPFLKQKFNLKDHFKDTWSIIPGTDKIDFKVLFHRNVARYIKEKELFVNPKLTDNADGSLLFEVTLSDHREFFKWVLQYGIDAEILEPIEYREKMKSLLSEWVKKY